ncbi:MAG: anion permease [Lewinellaceae bacterium]|nr:anion permease [Saprospiraceae bacterium]MCB9344721.1 anion permease [Lewinellaceae bacterium]
MSADIIITLIILTGAIILFATEVVSVDVTAMLIIGSLVITGILSPQEGIAGFANTAVVTVASMFVLSAGIEKSGALNPITAFLEKLFLRNFWLGVICMLLSVAFLSAFINNTPVVALFIPVVISCAKAIKISPEKLLIPLSFASMFGGVCTLIGTSTNILVSDYAASVGLGAFTMYEMTELGLIFLVSGLVYLLVIGIRQLPDKTAVQKYEEKYHLGDYITNVVLQKGASSIGKPLNKSSLITELGLEIFQVRRGNSRYFLPPNDFILEENDILKIKGNVDKIRKLKNRTGIVIQPVLNKEQPVSLTGNLILHEVVVLPSSDLSGVTVRDIDFEESFGAVFLGARSRKGLHNKLIGDWKLASGDCMLLASTKDKTKTMHKYFPDLFIINHTDYSDFTPKNALIASATIVSVILLASLGIFPIITAAFLGCLVLVLTRIVSPEDAYKSVSWKVIMLLAGSLSLGAALEKTGAAQLLANEIVYIGGNFGPTVVLSVVYLIATLLTSAMANNATVVLLAPIVISLAGTMGISPKPFLMAITFAASASFMTPIGYQTNTMVYAAGNYTFRDFFRIGAPLNLLFWIIASLMIPILFPF